MPAAQVCAGCGWPLEWDRGVRSRSVAELGLGSRIFRCSGRGGCLSNRTARRVVYLRRSLHAASSIPHNDRGGPFFVGFSRIQLLHLVNVLLGRKVHMLRDGSAITGYNGTLLEAIPLPGK